ncbi:MAG: hypothetical protein ACKVHE_25595 [Planctomycetales bacterium]|jgi:hypothetical protein
MRLDLSFMHQLADEIQDRFVLDDVHMARIQHRSWSLRRLTWVEWLVVVVVIGIVVALIIPGVKWASSGSIRFPVRVFVFDAALARPIPEARIAILHGPLPHSGFDIDDIRQRVPSDLFEYLPSDSLGLTGNDGTVIVHHEFSTGASHKRPNPHAHLQFAWVVVVAQGYGTVVVTVRHDSMSKLREHKELYLPIGLASAD